MIVIYFTVCVADKALYGLQDSTQNSKRLSPQTAETRFFTASSYTKYLTFLIFFPSVLFRVLNIPNRLTVTIV